ncbi:hypothetical protein PQX77_020216 [Marasmius sp. AFHP31]|nr:hypothetical protein PQX77_020216 [Marasmius sp. AFHP31]
MNRLCEKEWQAESALYRELLKKELEEEYEEKLTAWKNCWEWDGDAASYVKSATIPSVIETAPAEPIMWNKSAEVVALFLETLAKLFGAGCSIFLYGPDETGEIGIASIDAPIPEMQTNKELRNFDPKIYNAMVNTCLHFAKMAFTTHLIYQAPEYCAMRQAEAESGRKEERKSDESTKADIQQPSAPGVQMDSDKRPGDSPDPGPGSPVPEGTGSTQEPRPDSPGIQSPVRASSSVVTSLQPPSTTASLPVLDDISDPSKTLTNLSNTVANPPNNVADPIDNVANSSNNITLPFVDITGAINSTDTSNLVLPPRLSNAPDMTVLNCSSQLLDNHPPTPAATFQSFSNDSGLHLSNLTTQTSPVAHPSLFMDFSSAASCHTHSNT